VWQYHLLHQKPSERDIAMHAGIILLSRRPELDFLLAAQHWFASVEQAGYIDNI